MAGNYVSQNRRAKNYRDRAPAGWLWPRSKVQPLRDGAGTPGSSGGRRVPPKSRFLGSLTVRPGLGSCPLLPQPFHQHHRKDGLPGADHREGPQPKGIRSTRNRLSESLSWRPVFMASVEIYSWPCSRGMNVRSLPSTRPSPAAAETRREQLGQALPQIANKVALMGSG